MESVSHRLISLAKAKGYKVVSCYDFLDIGDYKTVSKAMERLITAGVMRRLRKGLYGICSRKSSWLEKCSFSDDHIALALSRKYGWVIAPDGKTAASLLGLVPRKDSAETTYVSSGPYKRYKVDGRSICFKRQSGRYLGKLSPLTILYVEAMKGIGKSRLSSDNLRSSIGRLGRRKRALLEKEKSETPPWIRRRLTEALNSTELRKE